LIIHKLPSANCNGKKKTGNVLQNCSKRYSSLKNENSVIMLFQTGINTKDDSLKKWLFCPYNESQWGLVLFWSKIIVIVWAKTVLSILFCVLQKKESHTGVERHEYLHEQIIIFHFQINYCFNSIMPEIQIW